MASLFGVLAAFALFAVIAGCIAGGRGEPLTAQTAPLKADRFHPQRHALARVASEDRE